MVAASLPRHSRSFNLPSHLLRIPLKAQQLRQIPQRTPPLQEIMLQQLIRTRATPNIHTQTNTQESLELLAQLFGFLEAWGPVGGDEVECFEGFLVEVGGFGFDHLDGHDAKGPDVDFGAVFFLLDDFGRHPVGGADHGCAFGFCFGEFGAEAKVSWGMC